jgi:hypothetical protein
MNFFQNFHNYCVFSDEDAKKSRVINSDSDQTTDDDDEWNEDGNDKVKKKKKQKETKIESDSESDSDSVSIKIIGEKILKLKLFWRFKVSINCQ